MTDLGAFERELQALIGRPTDLRPFVCDGSPLECSTFIVGLNPATTLTKDFWHFWRTGTGFDKAAWFEEYKRERQVLPLKTGKSRRNAISNTRRVIEWVIEEAGPVHCLETNIYSLPTAKAVDLSEKQRVTAPLDFLLEKIRPRVIVTHGADAVGHFSGKNLRAHIIRVPHFSRCWSQARARALGQQLRA
jgi:hypothetical protein